MTFTPEQAVGKLTIATSNMVAATCMLILALFFYYRSQKTPLLYSYLSILGLLILWTGSKVIKTVTPNVTLRWSCVVIQYVGVQFLGLSIFIFALLYAGYSLPKKEQWAFLLIHPIISFLAVATNPLHYGFYSVFEYGRTRFGWMFLPSQFILYGYILAGMFLLVRRSFDSRFHAKKKIICRLFASCALAPLLINFYYITFKLTDIPWIFPFRPFDVTPIAMALSITFFAIPASIYRFLDIVPLSRQHVYDHFKQGVIWLNPSLEIVDMNPAVKSWLPSNGLKETKAFVFEGSFETVISFFFRQDQEKNRQNLWQWIILPPTEETTSFRTVCRDRHLKWRKMRIEKDLTAILFIDITEIVGMQEQLQASQKKLEAMGEQLENLAKKEKELAVFRARSLVSQNVHDFIGHSLTVVMGKLELALLEKDGKVLDQCLYEGKELLLNNLTDLQDSLCQQGSPPVSNLEEAILSLATSPLQLEVRCQGTPYVLEAEQNEAVYRLCREAITNAIRHGSAKTLHIFLRYQQHQFEVYAIDDGSGCTHVTESLGLKGIRERIEVLGGRISFGSGEGGGFHIYGEFPLAIPSPSCL
ncbi:sensor histidine kinase [Tindallia californiensis]|uniref:histidine kinase n=1 Tax=Tindallia californiensis TaxID=159292 RepID=A0A1H3P922_9FIRM|nr:histidine kinase N-terminal 7TM domain-containing protein [Tindallia californiensis]SDY97540.1 N-terminal 7TM region of histidine kinase [Tindallia californiensis]